MSKEDYPEPAELGALGVDIEANLARLHQLKAIEASAKKEYEQLRDEVAALQFGSAYFIDEAGIKRYGYVVNPENLEIDEAGLMEELQEDLLDQVAPRRLDRKAFEQAVKTGRISTELFLKYTRLTRGTSHIRFGTND